MVLSQGWLPSLTVESLIKLPIMVPKAFQAGYPDTTGFRKVVKATIYIKKKDGMADEDFIEYYNTKHAQRAVPILQRHGIISYSLVILLLTYACSPLLWYPVEIKLSATECLRAIVIR